MEKINLLILQLNYLKEVIPSEHKALLEELSKSIKILEQGNKLHFLSIKNKLFSFTRMVYETGILYNMDDDDYNKTVCKIKNIETLIDEISLL